MGCRLPFFIFIFQIILAIFLCNEINANKFNNAPNNNTQMGKIIGGVPVDITQFPFAVQFINFGGICAGSIVTSYAVLTAAHCFDYNKDVDDMTIYAGARYFHDHNADIYDVDHFVIHKNYNKTVMFANDIGLIFLTKTIKMGPKVQKAIIVNSKKWMNKKKIVQVTGWGWTQVGGPVSHMGLMMTNLSYVSLKKCMKLHHLLLTKDMVCLYGGGKRDSCGGDSGGAVVWKGMIVAVVSHGDDCAVKHKPGMYANLYYFRRWIFKTLSRFEEAVCNKEHANVIVAE